MRQQHVSVQSAALQQLPPLLNPPPASRKAASTGLSSVFTAAMFFIAMFLAPIAVARARAALPPHPLVFVGILDDRRRQGNRVERPLRSPARVHDHGAACRSPTISPMVLRSALSPTSSSSSSPARSKDISLRHLDHRHTVRGNVLHCPLITDIRIV